MPVAPLTWPQGFFLSASRLNGELYTTAGQAFAANGPRWHSMTPVYKSSALTFPTLPTNTWTQMGRSGAPGNESFLVVGDTGAYLGSGMDPNLDGVVQCNIPNSGGASGVSGGLGLMTAFPSVAAGTGEIAAGIGPVGTQPVSTGTWQNGSASTDMCCFALDIVDLANLNTGWAFSDQASPSFASGQVDGSGDSGRLGCHWASVYKANGNTVSNPLPIVSPGPYTSTFQWTSAYLNTQIATLMNVLNMPPLLRVQANAATSLPASTATTINLPGATYDTYNGWNSGTDTYTCPLSGIYLVYGCVPTAGGWTGFQKTAININGTNFWGPNASATTTAFVGSAKVGTFVLNAGSTIKMNGFQNNSSAVNTVSSGFIQSVLVVLYLGPAQANVITSAPDTTFRYMAGMSAASALAGINNHMSPDLAFLAARPSFLANQQSGFSIGSYTSGTNVILKMDTVLGDPYNGWNALSGTWTAPVAGWYLCTAEYSLGPLSASGGPVRAAFTLGVSGLVGFDIYQQALLTDTTNPYGAAAVGYYYLRAGDTISPSFSMLNAPGTIVVTGGGACHMELTWIGE